METMMENGWLSTGTLNHEGHEHESYVGGDRCAACKRHLTDAECEGLIGQIDSVPQVAWLCAVCVDAGLCDQFNEVLDPFGSRLLATVEMEVA